MLTHDILGGTTLPQKNPTINLGQGITISLPQKEVLCFNKTYDDMMRPKDLPQINNDIMRQVNPQKERDFCFSA